MKLVCGFDHAGETLRESVIEALRAEGHEVDDLGTCDDYPDAALRVATAVHEKEAARGIVVCGSGAGVSVAAAKLEGIRAACCHDHYSAAQCVSHDDCNVLCLGARVIGPAVAGELAVAFADAEFSGEERHARRLAKIETLERDGWDASL
ncbi:MAG TPA: RpiB/LacA/LacB family sugar-phosphate isomerase [Solirubrobacteraceae bacterium]|nr:RpiB/LacA/LacB family sugar-phosphate isomerase [Solirubrobacteraceae bacterium]